MSVGEKIKTCRKEIGFSQEYVSEKINVSRQTISNWENGKTLPDIYSLISLSELYNISLDELIKGDTSMMKKFKADESLKERTMKIIGVAGLALIAFSIGHNQILGNSDISSFIMGTSTGIVVGSIVLLAILYIKNYIDNSKKAEK